MELKHIKPKPSGSCFSFKEQDIMQMRIAISASIDKINELVDEVNKLRNEIERRN